MATKWVIQRKNPELIQLYCWMEQNITKENIEKNYNKLDKWALNSDDINNLFDGENVEVVFTFLYSFILH